MTDSPQGVKATERPLYYAKHGMVWKRPVEKKHEDGSTTVSLGFPVCKLHEACEGQEEQIAEMLCRAESHDALVKALEEARSEIEQLRVLALLGDFSALRRNSDSFRLVQKIRREENRRSALSTSGAG